MIKIDKDTKVWILSIVISTVLIVTLLTLSQEFKQEIFRLKSEISELEIHKEELLKELMERKKDSIRILGLEQVITELEKENKELRIIRAKLTAYSPLDNVDGIQATGNPSITSRGYPVGRSVAAVDPKKIPYGTVLEIPGYGIVECQDTGGALRRDNENIRIDLFMSTYKEAVSFGVQDKEVKILEWGDSLD